MLIYSKEEDSNLSYTVDTRVYVKQSWSDDWTWAPWLHVETVYEKAAPYIGETVIVLDFEDILTESIGNYEIYNDSYLLNAYVKVETSTMYGDETLWAGIIEEKMSSNTATGEWQDDVEKYKALSIEILLSRIAIDKSYTEDGTVNKVFTFNNEGIGNRSTAKTGGTYVFSSDGEDWTVYNIIEYIIERFVNPTITFEISGNTDVIDSIVSTYVPESNALYVLNQLIDQSYGIGWHSDMNSSDELSINIFSRTSSSVQTPIGTIPQNTMSFNLDLSSIDSTNYSYSLDAIPKYEVIDIIGGPITVCFTATVGNGLTEGWESADESAYRTAGGGAVAVRDTYRANYRSLYTDTFQKFSFDESWDWGSWDTASPILVDCNPATGELNPDSTSLVSFWDYDKSFNQYLPYKDDDDDYNYKRPFLLQLNRSDWINRERIKQTTSSEDNMHMHISEDELALYVEAEPNHLTNYDEDSVNYSAYSAIPPVCDYSDFYVTLSVDTDEVLRYTITSAYVADVPKLKTVNLPNKVAWYIAPDTIKSFIGIDMSEVSITSSTGEFARNDMSDLILVANLMFNWHVYTRSVLNYTYNDILLGYPIGSIVSEVETSSDIKPVNTPVVERYWRFRGGDTVVSQIKTDTINWDVE